MSYIFTSNAIQTVQQCRVVDGFEHSQETYVNISENRSFIIHQTNQPQTSLVFVSFSDPQVSRATLCIHNGVPRCHIVFVQTYIVRDRRYDFKYIE